MRPLLPPNLVSSFALGFVALAGLSGCGEKPPPAPESRTVEVTAVTVEPRDVPWVNEFVGQTESSRQVEIRARVDGYLDKRVYTEGALVQEGDVLFLIDRKPFEAQLAAAKAELAQQVARLDTARANLARIRPLAADDAVSQKDLDDAVGSEQGAAAAVEAARAKVEEASLNLSYTTIRSPVTGLSSFAKQQEGSYVNPQNSLLTYVAALDPMRVNFSVSENQMLRAQDEVAAGRLHRPKDGAYDVEMVLSDGTSWPTRGRIRFADAGFSRETGTFLVRAEFANPKGVLRPGQFVQVRVHGAVRPGAMIVPRRAVQQGAKGSFVWVVKDGQAQPRPVEPGPWLGDEWIIDKGLAAGDVVAVNGAVKLRPEAPVKTVPDPAATVPSPPVEDSTGTKKP